ncbi:YdcF family protein [Rickettsiales bacterium]|nr:YdcF family protein [Rickettsiales bacterium]
MHSKTKHIYFLAFLLIVSVFWWFFYLLKIFPEKYYANTDNLTMNPKSAIIVLTGGKGRFEKGLSILKSDISERLFVSGVFPGLDIKSKYISDDDESELFNCCIYYGNEAINTNQNADEVKKWIENYPINTIFLVSSYYHLPRSKIIFENKMPGVNILLIPSDDNFFESKELLTHLFNLKLIVTEYFKIIFITIFGI